MSNGDNTRGKHRGLRPPWQPGHSGNPAGRPKGSRNKLGERFIADVFADWSQHGGSVLKRVRQASPAAYLRVVAGLVPQRLEVTAEDQPANMTAEELWESLAQNTEEMGMPGVARALRKHGREMGTRKLARRHCAEDRPRGARTDARALTNQTLKSKNQTEL
jgi:hypothetical protein